MKTVCGMNDCTACGLCEDMCPRKAITLKIENDGCNAVIDEQACSHCQLCLSLCPNVTPVPMSKPIFIRQGWATDHELVSRSASGGLVAAIMRAFIEEGGCVCSCRGENGRFVFAMTDDVDQVARFQGSKYVKSDPRGIYQAVRDCLNAGRKVLFVGLPCQCAAVLNSVRNRENLYTIDILCHGTPAPQLLEKYLREGHIRGFEDVRFRVKGSRIEAGESFVGPQRVHNSYVKAYMESLSHTDNCYRCPYARAERAADLTLGDSWGSELPADRRDQGVSLALCMTEKGKALLSMAPLELIQVDYDRAARHNEPLRQPARPHRHRGRFLKAVSLNLPFRMAVALCFPRYAIKNSVKYGLIRAGLLKPESRPIYGYKMVVRRKPEP